MDDPTPTAMNLVTPYGDSLLHSVAEAFINTAIHSFFALFISLVIGTLISVVNNILRTNALTYLMRTMDAVGPILPLLAVVSAFQLRSELSVSFVLGAITWNGFALFLSEEILSMRRSGFVEASRAMGSSALHRVLKHILPSIMPRLVPMLIGMYSSYAGLIGAVGFLGISSDPRGSLGFMIFDAISYIQQSPVYFWTSVLAFLLLAYIPLLAWGIWISVVELLKRR